MAWFFLSPLGLPGADLDRVLKAKPAPKRVHPNSIANLRMRHATKPAEGLLDEGRA